MTLAWMTVNLAASTWARGRVPDLQPLLLAGRPAPRQTLAEQKAILEQLAQRLGRRLTTKHDRAKGSDGSPACGI